MASSKLDVYVKLPTGRTAVYYVASSDTILTICKHVAGEEKVKDNQIRLKYQGKLLDRSHSLSYLGVRVETILKAEILVPHAVTLLLTLPNGVGVTELTSTNLEALDNVIERVADLIKEDKSCVLLKFNGRPVRGDTLLDAGLVDGSALEVEVKKPDLFNYGDKQESDDLDDHIKQVIVNSFVTHGKPVEIVFSFDTTGSMYGVLQEVRAKLKECCTRLIQDIPSIRIGIIAHGDYCDVDSSYVIRILDLTSDAQAILNFVTETPRSGGCGPAACYEWVLRKAQTLDWSEDSAKALVVIGDEKPHDLGYTDARVFWRDELGVLTGMGVKVYGVRALTAGSEQFYEEISEVSGGHYLRMSHFDIITDMFLAVCYRESQEGSASAALEAFAREVEEEGRMTEERRLMFQQLDEQQREPLTVPLPDGQPSRSGPTLTDQKQLSKRYASAAWWDPSLCQGVPSYHYEYDQERKIDIWVPYRLHSNGVAVDANSGVPLSTATPDPERQSRSLRSRTASSFKVRNLRHKCAIM